MKERIVCLFKGHLLMKRVRLVHLDDSPTLRYIGKEYKCVRCGKQVNL